MLVMRAKVSQKEIIRNSLKPKRTLFIFESENQIQIFPIFFSGNDLAANFTNFVLGHESLL
jgi:hypothetical protein